MKTITIQLHKMVLSSLLNRTYFPLAFSGGILYNEGDDSCCYRVSALSKHVLWSALVFTLFLIPDLFQ